MSYLLKKQKILLAVRLSSRKINIKNIISIISLSLEELDNFLLIKEQASYITVKSDNWRGVEIVFFLTTDELAPLRRTIKSITPHV